MSAIYAVRCAVTQCGQPQAVAPFNGTLDREHRAVGKQRGAETAQRD